MRVPRPEPSRRANRPSSAQLARQLARLGLDAHVPPDDARRWQALLMAVGRHYARLEAAVDRPRPARHAEAGRPEQRRRDELTGLPNRNAFFDAVAGATRRAQARGTRFALLCVDVDGFREINEALGHDAGDELLRQLARRVRASLRRGDRLARFGGDEFLVLIDPVHDRANVESVARNLLRAISMPTELDGLTATVGARAGVAIFPEDGDDPRQLLRNATTAAHRAPRDSRAALSFYAPHMNASLRDKLALVSDLRAAVSGDDLGLAYQPIVDGHDGRLLGVEALSRWDHAERGAVASSVFVQLAEETGLIGAIGAAVLERACRQLVEWDSQHADPGIRPYLSVNVAPAQLRDDGFAPALRATLAATTLEPARLQLELTEGMVMADPARAAQVLGELSALGVRIALDDFGTGYSSLAYLRTFPIDCIKIDRVFVQDLAVGDRHGPVVPAIVAIAASLGAVTVAEGVESATQMQALLAMGCRGMQGYLFARPLSAAAFAERFVAPPPRPARLPMPPA